MSIDAYDLSKVMVDLCNRERVLFTHVGQNMETEEAMLPDGVMPLVFMYAAAEAKKSHLDLMPEIEFFSSESAACRVEMVVNPKNETHSRARRRKSFLALMGCHGLKSIIDDISSHGAMSSNSLGWRVLESRWVMAALYHKHGDIYDLLLQNQQQRERQQMRNQAHINPESSSMSLG